MTTVSVHPTTSEPNEREAFENLPTKFENLTELIRKCHSAVGHASNYQEDEENTKQAHARVLLAVQIYTEIEEKRNSHEALDVGGDEREEFEKLVALEGVTLVKINVTGVYSNFITQMLWKLWQHQQKRIVELEEAIRLRDSTVAKESNQFQSLQAQLTIAVNALKRIELTDGALTITDETAHEALAEIKRIGE